MYNEKDVEVLKAKIEKNESIISKIDSFSTLLVNRKNDVASYTYIFSFRGNDTLDVKILYELCSATRLCAKF